MEEGAVIKVVTEADGTQNVLVTQVTEAAKCVTLELERNPFELKTLVLPKHRPVGSPYSSPPPCASSPSSPGGFTPPSPCY